MRQWEYLNANGVELAYLSAGGAGNRGLVLYLHGFPDTARAFEFMLEPTASAGWRGVSLETRGIPPSALAPGANQRDPGDYSLPTLAADIAQAIRALGSERAVLVGHDWGAVIAAAAAAFHPGCVAGVVLVGFPHISRAKVTLGGLLQRPHHLLFQFGKFGRWLTARNDLAYIERMYRVWAPSWKVPPDYLERVKAALREPDRLRAALEYYVQIWRMRNDRAMLDQLARQVAAPGLIIGGDDEPAFRQRWLEASRDCFLSKADIEMWPGVGHWPHSESPVQFEERVIDFLRKLQ